MPTRRAVLRALMMSMILCTPACTDYSFSAYGLETVPARIVSVQASPRAPGDCAYGHPHCYEVRVRFSDGGEESDDLEIHGIGPVSSELTTMPARRSEAVPPNRASRPLELVFNDDAYCFGLPTGYGWSVRRHADRLTTIQSSLPWKLLPLTLLVDLAFLPITLPGTLIMHMVVQALPRR